jgi:hypothetical protein
MALGKISREQMLLEMQTANGKPFLVKFIKAEDGTVKVIEQCLYGGQKREKGSGTVNKSGQKRKVTSLKETGKIPLFDDDAPEGDAYRSPFISHIFQFNNYQVRH